jgi:cysteinyl-tRNA synthetase
MTFAHIRLTGPAAAAGLVTTRPPYYGPGMAIRARFRVIAALAAWAVLAAIAPGALAQTAAPEDDGYVRIQGRDRGAGAVVPPAGGGGILRDFREDMRLFVQRIGEYARGYNPTFSIVIEDGLELLEKRDSVEDSLTTPARTFMRSIDGVLATGLFHGGDSFSKPTPEEERAPDLARLERAKTEGLNVLILDHTDAPDQIDAGYAAAEALGAPYYAVPSADMYVNAIAAYPARPFDENPNNVLTLDAARNFAVLTNSAAMGRVDEYALAMQRYNFDLLIVSPFHGRKPLSRQAVETLKYKKIGARRQVYARIDIGTAPSYAYFWQDDWRPGSPTFISQSTRSDPDLYRVLFWSREWQQIIFGDTQSYIYGLIAQGYDGVVLSGLDAFRFFETGGESEETE